MNNIRRIHRTCLEILNRAVEKLRSEGIDRPRTNAELLLGAVLDAKKIDLYLDRDRILSPQQVQKFNQFIQERIAGKPLQYIIGSTEFFGLEFEVSQNVLIPRPETETLVETVIEHLKNCSQPKIIDLGTGSGAIAISLAKNLKSSFVFATDVSSEALKVAKENARRHGVESQIEFVCGDLFDPLEGKKLEKTIDCVVSNPPYVSKDEFDHLPKEVKDYEPIVALRTDEEGPSFHKKIIEGSLDFLKEGGMLALEVGLGQASKVAGLIRNRKDLKNTAIKKDLGGIDRIVIAHKT
ncbi:MAG: peptide chain release factor N(5)-glutamine methyltransferase [candidate division Zixibacteria bacterium]|nr:peptide chain release factor N(5)-glutamine methyltransferase [candidate division Zixibacteria bacterium]